MLFWIKSTLICFNLQRNGTRMDFLTSTIFLQKAPSYKRQFWPKVLAQSSGPQFWPFNNFFLQDTVMLATHKRMHIVIRPHIFSTYNDTRSIVERTPHSHIQRYFCHKHDADKRICLSISFCQHYCKSCSFLLFHFLL